MHSRSDVAWHESVEDMGTAVWWPSAGIRSKSNIRHLEGEIKLAKDLRPTTSVGHFSISVSTSAIPLFFFTHLLHQYQVVLRPFDVPYFTSDSWSLLSEPVEIATMHAKGPRPHAYSPPAYAPTTRPPNEYYAPPNSTGPAL